MSVFENVFGKLNAWVRKGERQRRSAFQCTFEELYPSLLVMAQGALKPDQTALQLKGHEGFGSLYDHTLLLPLEFAPFDDFELNRDLFLHKALAGGMLRRLGILTCADRKSFVQRSLEIALLRGRVEDAAAAVFPEYPAWADRLRERHSQALAQADLGDVDSCWLRIEARFQKDMSESHALTGEGMRTHLRELEARLPPELSREVDRLPGGALAAWCEPIQARTLLNEAGSSESKRKRSEAEQTEKEGRSASEIEVVDLEKEKKNQNNPVFHSFEKLETADEYQGGFKTTDSSDELAEHQNALDELNLKKVTRGGDAAASTYRADIADLVHTESSAEQAAKKIDHVYYPEWDYQARQLRPKYCRLYLEKPEPPTGDGGKKWLEGVLERNEQGLEEWKHRLSMLVNQRRWRDRQWEGSEISIDAFVRYWSDVRFAGAGDPRLYVKNFAAMRDFTCLVLVDQSYSTDSWVKNRRVLDVELESLALVSELLAPLREPVAVAGTWSETRNHCHFRLYKDFNDPWQRMIDHAPAIVPQGYTRLGPAIRHANELLAASGGKRKLLILLTDGKPTDYDRYEGRYGIEDIHHACLEATQKGISVRALTIEKEAKNYFPHLFGARQFQILQNPEELPERLFRIYLETVRS